MCGGNAVLRAVRGCEGPTARFPMGIPALSGLVSIGPNPQGVHHKREPTKHKRRDEARKFGVNDVRADRANHAGVSGWSCLQVDPGVRSTTRLSRHHPSTSNGSTILDRVARLKRPDSRSSRRNTWAVMNASPSAV